jgi:hypothetical protein
MLGFIPGYLDDNDPRPAREQLDENYREGGGWHPVMGFTVTPNGELNYPGDPPMPLLAETILHPETTHPEVIRLYLHSWVSIIQMDGSFEIARMD